MGQGDRQRNVDLIKERKQQRPADWPKELPSLKLYASAVSSPKSEWKWRKLATVQALELSDVTTYVLSCYFSRTTESLNSSAAVKYGDSQLAIFRVPGKGLFATQQVSKPLSVQVA